MEQSLVAVCLEELRRNPRAWRVESARRLRISIDTLDHRLRKTPNWKELKDKAIAERAEKPADMDPTNPEVRALEQRVLALSDQNAVMRRKLAARDRDDSSSRFVLDRLEELVPTLPPVPPPKPIKADRGTSVETAVQLLSDGHFFEQVSPERTRGFNMYNAQLGAARLALAVHKHLEIKQRMEAGGGWNFPRLFVPLLGDWVSGTIHDAERHSDASIVEASIGAAFLLAQALRRLAAEYPSVYVAGVVGNHGRLPDARRKQHKDPTRNWDYLIHEMTRLMCKDIDHMEWYLPRAFEAQVEVEGHQLLLTHGDNVNSWGAWPQYGMTRYASALQASEASRENQIDYFLMGHWHDLYNIPVPAARLIVNGSIVGTTEYDIGSARVSEPKQLMFGMKPEHGVTFQFDLKLQHIPDQLEPFQLFPPVTSADRLVTEIGDIPVFKVA